MVRRTLWFLGTGVLLVAVGLAGGTLAGGQDREGAEAEKLRPLGGDPGKAKPDEQRIRKLIDDLGDRDFEVREEATRALMGIGEPALPYLEEAAKSKNREVEYRARELLEDIRGRTLRPREQEVPEPPLSDEFRRQLDEVQRQMDELRRRLDEDMSRWPELRWPAWPELRFRAPDSPGAEQFWRRHGEIWRDGEKVYEETRESYQGSGLGVRVETVPPPLRSHLRLKEREGVLVASVQDGSPAQKGGLRRYDVILRFDGKAVDGIEAIQEVVRRAPGGKPVEIEIIREGARETIKATLPSRKPERLERL